MIGHGFRFWALMACLLPMGAVLAATIEGEAVYRERILPPTDAFLVISLENTARADALSIELASSRTRLAAGPPYRWRLEYDERQLDASSRPVLRARIETPSGLWMTTDTVVSASTPAPVLQLRTVQRPAANQCADASTQAAINECAYASFLATSAAMSQQLRGIEAALTSAQRVRWRRAQKAWMTYRTETCQFEAAAVGQGSARQMVQWQCSARLTTLRTAELASMGDCPEGDISCTMHKPRKTP